MTKFNIFASLLSVSLMLTFCETGRNQETSDLGTVVHFVKKDSVEERLVNDNIIHIQFRFENDSGLVLSESNPDWPAFMRYAEDTLNANGQFWSVLEMLSVGDSVTFMLPAKELKMLGIPIPPETSEESNIFSQVSIVDQMNKEEYQAYQAKKQEEYIREALKTESGIIDRAIAEKGQEAITTESGLRYVVLEEGDGEQPEAGQEVTVRYRGTLLSDGKEFDAGDYSFRLGAGEVIPGWDEGIAYLNVGTKAILYIPSPLAYGNRGGGPIPPNAPLVFEVELLAIK